MFISRYIFGFIFCATALAVEISYQKDIEPLLVNYCFDCHGDGLKKGDFAIDAFGDLSEHLGDRTHWYPIWSNLRSQIMPPSDEAQPSAAEKKKLLSWIETEVFKLDPKDPDPGRVTIRRLNRSEYQYAIYDLLGVEYDTTEVFPPDDSGYGFDNIGDVLSISPLLMEKYLTAAEEIVNLALPDDASAQVPRADFLGKEFKHPSIPPSWIPFANEAELVLEVPITWDGKYQIIFEYSIGGATEATTAGAVMELFAGKKRLEKETLGWDQRQSIDLETSAHLKKGQREIRVSLKPTDQAKEGEEPLYLRIHRLILKGPIDGKQREYSKGYQMILGDGPVPEDEQEAARYARKIMRSFVSRAFRRPVVKGDIDRLVSIVRETDKLPGKTFQDGIKQAIATCLSSPRFLFRVEIQPEPNNPNKVVPLDEYALASRLSFFLWSSVPDDELLSLAFNKKLRTNLRQQVERMLADPRSERLTENFIGQWLQARDVMTTNISTATILGVENNAEAAKAFDPRLRQDMQNETYALFNFILRNERPAEELISARYSFLNERLADFYGIEGVKGEELRPVDLTEHPERGGLLTQGTFLIVTSNPTRTSPVKRGMFVLDNLLGTPPPPAPPDIPELEEAMKKAEGGGEPTMREMMQIHRDNPDCRGCHARMDPIGLGLENFDALGRFRVKQSGKHIDAAGELVTGEKFSNVATLKEILAEKRKTDYYRALSEKMLTYAIGRGVEIYDTTTVDQLVAHLEANDGKLVELIHAITTSAPFQKRRGDQ
ncbi:MAG: DUF1592 domain-containing protein [Akkermansiaceae bacterium]